jgi:hypothetical protein
MKRLLTGTFALLYTAFSVAAVLEHTASWNSDSRGPAKSRSTSVRAIHSPRPAQKRIVEDPFAVSVNRVLLALHGSDTHTLQHQYWHLTDNSPRTQLSRAPPSRLFV